MMTLRVKPVMTKEQNCEYAGNVDNFALQLFQSCMSNILKHRKPSEQYIQTWHCHFSVVLQFLHR